MKDVINNFLNSSLGLILLSTVVPALIACNSGYECGSFKDNLFDLFMFPIHISIIFVTVVVLCVLPGLIKSRWLISKKKGVSTTIVRFFQSLR